jgi:hypothetical protein
VPNSFGSLIVLIAIVIVVSAVFLLNSSSAESEPVLSPAAVALDSLENAYRQKDIEAAVQLKDFESEAKLMSGELIGKDKDVLASVTEVLELSFRKDIQENGFPNFDNIKCQVVSEIPAGEYYHLTEECTLADGSKISQILIASNIGGKWRIVGLLE